MTADERRLFELAQSVADGSPVDWKDAEGESRDAEQGELIRSLRSIAQIAEVHRTLAPATATGREPTPVQERDGTGDSGGGKGEPWGPLRILEKLDEGTFGEVFRAWDPTLDREVALKVLKPHIEAEDGDGSSLVREGRLLAKLRHPNVLGVYGADRVDGRVGIWTELVHGRTLAELVRDQGPLGAQEATTIGLDLCRALSAVHAAGLVHGDVKPQNVMREQGGRILLMDFSSGRSRFETPAEGDKTSGTPLYMAPEVLTGGAAPGVQTDIYGLGVLLYHLVTGAHPIEARSVAELCARHARGETRLLGEIRPDLPRAFVEAVEGALAAEPQQRYASAAQMEQALGAALGLGRETGPKTAPEPQPAAPRRSWPVYAALAAAVVLAAALLVGFRDTLLPGGAYTVETNLYRAIGEREQRLIPGSSVGVGDELLLKFSGSRDLYVYVFNEDEQGESYLLFPMPDFELKNPLPGGRTHRLPGPRNGKEFHWQVTSAGGREHFLIVASPKRLVDLESEMAAMTAPGDPGSPAAYARLSEEAKVRLRGLGGITPATSGDESPATTADAPSSGHLFDRIQNLASGPESARGVWMRHIEVANP